MIKRLLIKLTLPTMLVLLIAISSCRKDSNLLVADATVLNTGTPAADGCGWMVKIDSTYYSPVNLPDDYKKSNSKVRLTFNVLTTKYQCGFAPLSYSQIDIKSIKNK